MSTASSASSAADRPAGHDRDPGRRPAGADARPGGPGDGLPDRGPRPGSGLPGGGRRRHRDRRRLRRRRRGAPARRAQRRRHLRAGARRAEVVDAVDAVRPGPPGPRARSTSPRTGWPSGGSSESAGAAVAPWREVRTTDDLRAAADASGLPAAAQGRDRRLRRPGPGPRRGRRPRSTALGGARSARR